MKNISSIPKLGAWALISLVMLATLPVTGCTPQQKISVAQEIVNWTPTFVSTADLVNSAVMAMDPPTVAILVPLTLGINTFAPEFQKAAQAYLANPTQTNLQLLQTLIVQIQQDANQALLAAARIVNPTSQAAALRNINLVATIVTTLLSLIQSITTRSGLFAMSTHSNITLEEVRVHMDLAALYRNSQRVTSDLGYPISAAPTPNQFFAYEEQSGF